MADQGQEMFQEQGDKPTEQGMFNVGGREYTADDAKKKIENADQFIETLKSEKSELAAKYSQMEEKLAELSSRLDTSLKLEDAINTPKAEPQPQRQQEQTTPVVDEEALLRKLRQSLAKESQQEVHAKNMKTSIEAATKVYGTEWQSKLLEKGAELGMSSSDVEKMAKTQPVAFSKLFGLTKEVKGEAAPTGGQPVGHLPQQTEAPKSVMFGATTKDLVEQWRYSGKRVAEQGGYEYNPDVHKIKKQTFNRG